MSLTRTLVALATLFTLTVPTTALAADEVGARGDLISIEINNTTSDTYVQYHGKLVIKSGKKSQEYRWGGTSCTNKSLPENLVEVLLDAFLKRNTIVVPRFKDGAGTTRCLVGFSLERKKDTDDNDDDGDHPTPPAPTAH